MDSLGITDHQISVKEANPPRHPAAVASVSARNQRPTHASCSGARVPALGAAVRILKPRQQPRRELPSLDHSLPVQAL